MTQQEITVLRSEQNAKRYEAHLRTTVQPWRDALTLHPALRSLSDLPSLRRFMEVHVFAVWDFMSLAKTLQARLTCTSVPWRPPSDSFSARMINEIVLAEETDETHDGQYSSHFEAYLGAMHEVGADTTKIRRFLAALSEHHVERALEIARVEPAVRAFVLHTMKTTHAKTHEVAASFLLGREAIIPDMFSKVLESTSGLKVPRLTWYLQRHIVVDAQAHEPAGWQLLARLCRDDATLWAEAQSSVQHALRARRALWDSVLAAA